LIRPIKHHSKGSILGTMQQKNSIIGVIIKLSRTGYIQSKSNIYRVLNWDLETRHCEKYEPVSKDA